MHPNYNNNRSSAAPGKKNAALARPSKPPMTRNRSSYHAPSQSASRISLGANKRPTCEIFHDDEEAMESFLQFCATCERQIVTPGGSILYCSEACRKKDVSKPTSPLDISISPLLAPTYVHHEPPREDIVPPRSPTILRPLSTNFSELNLAELGSPAKDFTSPFGRQVLHSDRWTERDNHVSPAHRSSTATDHSGIPSLSHTPSSSVGTAASARSSRHYHSHRASTQQSRPCCLETINAGAPLSPTAKDSSLKSSASTLTTFKVAEAGALSYDKRRPSAPRRDSSHAQGSLRQLFAHEAQR